MKTGILRITLWTAFAAIISIARPAFAQQTFTISGGVASGSISTDSEFRIQNVSTILNGWHSGIECSMNQECSIQVSTTFDPDSFSEAQSQIFLTGWHFSGADGAEEVGRVRVRLTQNSYNPSTGAYSWTASFRLHTNTNKTCYVQYGFAIFRGDGSSNNVITKNLSKSCSGTGSCSVAATQNVLNVAPTGTTFAGFMMTGFDAKVQGATFYSLQRLAVDGSVEAAGTTEGGYSASNNRKQGMSCSFVNNVGSPLSMNCAVYTVAFSTTGTDLGYVVQTNKFVNSISYNASSPSPNWWTYQTHAVPSVPGSAFEGLFTPLRNFDLQYTSTVPLTRDVGAGCGNIVLNGTTTPPQGEGVVFDVISQTNVGNPPHNFSGSANCFTNWAQVP